MNISTKLLSLAAAMMVTATASAGVATVTNGQKVAIPCRQATSLAQQPSVIAEQATGLETAMAAKSTGVASRADNWVDDQMVSYETIIRKIYKGVPGTVNVMMQKGEGEDANANYYRLKNPYNFKEADVFNPEFYTLMDGEDELAYIPVQQTFLSISETVPVLYADIYSFEKYVYDNGNPYKWDEADFQADYDASYYSEVEGCWKFYNVYFIGTDGGSNALKYMTMGTEYIQKKDVDYPRYELSFSNPFFYNKGDNGYLSINVTKNSYTKVRFYCQSGTMSGSGEEIQNLINEIFSDKGDLDNYTEVSEDGLALIKIADGEAKEGPYSLLAIAYMEDGNGHPYLDKLTCTLSEEGWEFEGIGQYRDGIACDGLIIDDVIPNGSYVVQSLIEKNTTMMEGYTAYRLIHPYYAMGLKLSDAYSNISYDEDQDYMVVLVNDQNKACLQSGTTGITFTDTDEETGDETSWVLGFTSDCYLRLDTPADLDPNLWGDNNNGIITFPKAVEGAEAQALYVTNDGQFYGANVDGHFELVLPSAYVGIENVTAGADAPVVYYNLQGQRVANPQNGIFIRANGNKAVKVAL